MEYPEKEKQLSITSGIILSVVLVALAVLLAIFGGYVLTVLWGWFIVPTFHLPPLTIPVALGLSTLAMTMNGTYSVLARIEEANRKKRDGLDNFIRTSSLLLAVGFTELVALGTGYIYTLFM